MTVQLGPPHEDDSVVPHPQDGRVALSRCPVTGAGGGEGAEALTGLSAPEVAPLVDADEAEEFVRQHHAETALPGVEQRVREVISDVESTGSYTHTTEELAFATRVAWRNAAKCVGRLPWSKLVVRDQRHLASGAQIAADCVQHLHQAWNGGAVLPTISVYEAAAPGTAGPRIWNPQLIRYAGYRGSEGRAIGDPSTAALTDYVGAEHGWSGPRTPFDVLPLVVSGSEEDAPFVLELPADAVEEVEISHPTCAAITDLGLRWHALPVIADQRLEAGGLWYTCAPFSGWYLADEVGARNFADEDRYDMLPAVARCLGLDTTPANPYWRDLAQVELTRAVHHSFKRARVTITDHHSEDKRMMTFARGVRRRGHRLEVEWGWVTPPFGASLTRAWHELYDGSAPDVDLRPAYVRQSTPTALHERPV